MVPSGAIGIIIIDVLVVCARVWVVAGATGACFASNFVAVAVGPGLQVIIVYVARHDGSLVATNSFREIDVIIGKFTI
jgi:hypothetical protein